MVFLFPNVRKRVYYLNGLLCKGVQVITNGNTPKKGARHPRLHPKPNHRGRGGIRHNNKGNQGFGMSRVEGNGRHFRNRRRRSSLLRFLFYRDGPVSLSGALRVGFLRVLFFVYRGRCGSWVFTGVGLGDGVRSRVIRMHKLVSLLFSLLGNGVGVH